MRLPFAIASYTHRSLPVSAQRVINLFAERQPESAKAPMVLLPGCGLREFAGVDTAVMRGAHVMGPDIYAVIGTGIYRVSVSGVPALLGSIPGDGPVSLDSNGDKLCVVVPATFEAYVVDRATGSVTQISGDAFDGATAVTVIDGYYAFSKPNSTQFFLSAINDPESFDALDFASAERSPDLLVAPMRVGGDLWLFGERTIEVWSNVGATDFPFLRVSGGLVSRGTAARFSIAVRQGTAVWLGDDRVVYAANGVQPQRLSTHAVEQAFAGYEDVSDAQAWIYELEGHAFYVLTFPSAGDTWVFDFASGLWHERESEGLGVWRACFGVPFAGGVVAGDTEKGLLWLLDPTYGLEGQAQIIRVATGTALHAEGRQVFYSRLAAEFEMGVGLRTGQGSDPRAWLSWSNDGGRTFSNAASVGLGRRGEYRSRAESRSRCCSTS